MKAEREFAGILLCYLALIIRYLCLCDAPSRGLLTSVASTGTGWRVVQLM